MNKIENLRFRPLQYPEFFEYYKLANMNPWTVFELDFLKDKQDWINHMDPSEKGAMTRGLTGFTQSEHVIGDNWTELQKHYTRPEILMMMRKFADQESTHLCAYNAIEENFDLDTFDKFVEDEEAVQKINTLMDLQKTDKRTSLAVFSGAVEGCSLFSIFALLVLFCRNNKMKTVKEILGWSAIDEEIHSQAGIKLYRYEMENLPQGFDMHKHYNDVFNGFSAVYNAECRFIDYVLPEDLPIANKNDLKNYLIIRLHRKIKELFPSGSLDGVSFPKWAFYGDPAKAFEIDRMMLTLVKGQSNSDFFAGKLTDSYTAKVTQNFKVLDYPSKKDLYEQFIHRNPDGTVKSYLIAPNMM